MVLSFFFFKEIEMLIIRMRLMRRNARTAQVVAQVVAQVGVRTVEPLRLQATAMY